MPKNIDLERSKCFINLYNFHCIVSSSRKKPAEPSICISDADESNHRNTVHNWKMQLRISLIILLINKLSMHVLTLLILLVNDHHTVWEKRPARPHKMLLTLDSVSCHEEIYLKSNTGLAHRQHIQ